MIYILYVNKNNNYLKILYNLNHKYYDYKII